MLGPSFRVACEPYESAAPDRGDRPGWHERPQSRTRLHRSLPNSLVADGRRRDVEGDTEIAGVLLAPLNKDRGPTLWVWPDLAYRFETHPTRGGHLFDVGLGVGFGTHLIATFYRPRLVLGGIDQGLGEGEPGLTMVEIGLTDIYYAEVISGLNNGDVVTIAKADIKEIAQDPDRSVMPDDLSEAMTVKDYQDILSFLMLQKGEEEGE